MSDHNKKLISSLDFFIITVVLLTLLSFIFKAELGNLFRREAPVQPVKVTLVCDYPTLEEADAAFAEGDTLSLSSGAVLGKIKSVSASPLDAGGFETTVILEGSASPKDKGFDFGGVLILEGETVVVSGPTGIRTVSVFEMSTY